MVYLVACYDVSLNRNRTRLERLLKQHGIRVQKSVFEIRLERNEIPSLLDASRQHLKEKDSFRLYTICGNCRKNSETMAETEWTCKRIPQVV